MLQMAADDQSLYLQEMEQRLQRALAKVDKMLVMT